MSILRPRILIRFISPYPGFKLGPTDFGLVGEPVVRYDHEAKGQSLTNTVTTLVVVGWDRYIKDLPLCPCICLGE